MHGYPAIIELGKPKQIFNQLFQSPRLSICNLYVLVLHLRRYLTVAGQQLQVSDDGCKGCAQVVGHIGYELVFGALRFPLLIHQLPDILLLQGLQLKNTRPGQQRPVHLKIWIFRGCADEDQRAVLHKGQKVVLLSLVETVNLVHEQDGFLPIHAHVVLGRMHHFLHVFFSGHRGVDLPEIGAGGVGDHLGQRGFSRARRSVKDNGAQLVRLDGPVQKLVPAHNVLLAHHLVQRFGAQPGGQRRL